MDFRPSPSKHENYFKILSGRVRIFEKRSSLRNFQSIYYNNQKFIVRMNDRHSNEFDNLVNYISGALEIVVSLYWKPHASKGKLLCNLMRIKTICKGVYATKLHQVQEYRTSISRLIWFAFPFRTFSQEINGFIFGGGKKKEKRELGSCLVLKSP